MDPDDIGHPWEISPWCRFGAKLGLPQGSRLTHLGWPNRIFAVRSANPVARVAGSHFGGGAAYSPRFDQNSACPGEPSHAVANDQVIVGLGGLSSMSQQPKVGWSSGALLTPLKGAGI